MGDEGPVDLTHLEQFVDDAVDRGDDHLLQFFEPSGFLGKDDPGDHILAVTDLAIIIRGLGQGEEHGAVTSSIRAAHHHALVEVEDLADRPSSFRYRSRSNSSGACCPRVRH